MKPTARRKTGPMRAHHVREGEPIELSNGHPIECLPAGGRHGAAQIDGAKALATDPAVDGQVGIDVGFTWDDGKYLRAPDIAVGAVERTPGWATKIPPLAVEYADTGQNEKELRQKISELHEAGTRIIWVVRLTGELRVEVHERGGAVQVVGADGVLTAPGILQNPVPVRALVDSEEADRTALRNLLQRRGYDSVEQIQSDSERKGESKGKLGGLRSALMTLLDSRGLDVAPETRRCIAECESPETLSRWIARAAVAKTAAEATD